MATRVMLNGNTGMRLHSKPPSILSDDDDGVQSGSATGFSDETEDISAPSRVNKPKMAFDPVTQILDKIDAELSSLTRSQASSSTATDSTVVRRPTSHLSSETSHLSNGDSLTLSQLGSTNKPTYSPLSSGSRAPGSTDRDTGIGTATSSFTTDSAGHRSRSMDSRAVRDLEPGDAFRHQHATRPLSPDFSYMNGHHIGQSDDDKSKRENQTGSPYEAKQVDEKFKEIMQKRKGGFLNRAGTDDDNQTVRTEDFVDKFQDTMVYSSADEAEKIRNLEDDLHSDGGSDTDTLQQKLATLTRTPFPQKDGRSSPVPRPQLDRPRRKVTQSLDRQPRKVGGPGTPPVYPKPTPTSSLPRPSTRSSFKYTPGHGSDADSVRTEDFEHRFKDMMVGGNNTAESDLDHDPIHNKVKQLLKATAKSSKSIVTKYRKRKDEEKPAPLTASILKSRYRTLSDKPKPDFKPKPHVTISPKPPQYQDEDKGDDSDDTLISDKDTRITSPRSWSGLFWRPNPQYGHEFSSGHPLRDKPGFHSQVSTSSSFDESLSKSSISQSSASSNDKERHAYHQDDPSSRKFVKNKNARGLFRQVSQLSSAESLSSFSDYPETSNNNSQSESTSGSYRDEIEHNFPQTNFRSGERSRHFPGYQTTQFSGAVRRRSVGENLILGPYSHKKIGNENMKNGKRKEPKTRDIIVQDEEEDQYPFSKITFNKKGSGHRSDESSSSFISSRSRRSSSKDSIYSTGMMNQLLHLKKGGKKLMNNASSNSLFSSVSSSMNETSGSSEDYPGFYDPSSSDLRQGRPTYLRKQHSNAALYPQNAVHQDVPMGMSNFSGSFGGYASPACLSPSSVYQPTSVEKVLNNLGFSDTHSFLPERFLKSWMDKVYMSQQDEFAHRMMPPMDTHQTYRSQYSYPDDHDLPPSVSAQQSGTSTPLWRRSFENYHPSVSMDVAARGKRHQLQRANTNNSQFSAKSSFSSLDDHGTDNMYTNIEPLPLKKENSFDKLKRILQTTGRVHYRDRDSKRYAFGSNRQNSLPICLEALSEEEDSRSSSFEKAKMSIKHLLLPKLLDESDRGSRSPEYYSDASRRSSVNHDTSRRSSVNHDTSRRSSVNIDPSRRSSGNLDNNRRSSGNQDASRRSSGNQDTSRRISGNHDTSRRSSGNQDASRRSSVNLDTSRRSSCNQDASRRSSVNQGSSVTDTLESVRRSLSTYESDSEYSIKDCISPQDIYQQKSSITKDTKNNIPSIYVSDKMFEKCNAAEREGDHICDSEAANLTKEGPKPGAIRCKIDRPKSPLPFNQAAEPFSVSKDSIEIVEILSTKDKKVPSISVLTKIDSFNEENRYNTDLSNDQSCFKTTDSNNYLRIYDTEEKYLSPSPSIASQLSPITVIEMKKLDNQNDSLEIVEHCKQTSSCTKTGGCFSFLNSDESFSSGKESKSEKIGSPSQKSSSPHSVNSLKLERRSYFAEPTSDSDKSLSEENLEIEEDTKFGAKSVQADIEDLSPLINLSDVSKLLKHLLRKLPQQDTDLENNLFYLAQDKAVQCNILTENNLHQNMTSKHFVTILSQVEVNSHCTTIKSSSEARTADTEANDSTLPLYRSHLCKSFSLKEHLNNLDKLPCDSQSVYLEPKQDEDTNNVYKSEAFIILDQTSSDFNDNEMILEVLQDKSTKKEATSHYHQTIDSHMDNIRPNSDSMKTDFERNCCNIVTVTADDISYGADNTAAETNETGFEEMVKSYMSYCKQNISETTGELKSPNSLTIERFEYEQWDTHDLRKVVDVLDKKEIMGSIDQQHGSEFEVGGCENFSSIYEENSNDFVNVMNSADNVHVWQEESEVRQDHVALALIRAENERCGKSMQRNKTFSLKDFRQPNQISNPESMLPGLESDDCSNVHMNTHTGNTVHKAEKRYTSKATIVLQGSPISSEKKIDEVESQYPKKQIYRSTFHLDMNKNAQNKGSAKVNEYNCETNIVLEDHAVVLKCRSEHGDGIHCPNLQLSHTSGDDGLEGTGAPVPMCISSQVSVESAATISSTKTTSYSTVTTVRDCHAIEHFIRDEDQASSEQDLSQNKNSDVSIKLNQTSKAFVKNRNADPSGDAIAERQSSRSLDFDTFRTRKHILKRCNNSTFSRSFDIIGSSSDNELTDNERDLERMNSSKDDEAGKNQMGRSDEGRDYFIKKNEWTSDPSMNQVIREKNIQYQLGLKYDEDGNCVDVYGRLRMLKSDSETSDEDSDESYLRSVNFDESNEAVVESTQYLRQNVFDMFAQIDEDDDGGKTLSETDKTLKELERLYKMSVDDDYIDHDKTCIINVSQNEMASRRQSYSSILEELDHEMQQMESYHERFQYYETHICSNCGHSVTITTTDETEGDVEHEYCRECSPLD